MSVEAAFTRVPVTPRPLIGRARELDEIRGLVLDEGARLLTLNGPAGVGKTRLALAAAGHLEPAFAEGARFVDLAPLDDPTLVASAIGRACGLLHDSAQAPMLALTRALGDRRFLLVLDNFEHVLEAAPDIGLLVETCRSVCILVTSREPLHLRSEWEFPIEPLPLPPLPAAARVLDSDDLDRLGHNPSVALFVQRARAVRPTFSLGGDNARAVAELCIRLDGLPLAIELAAARIRYVPSAAVTSRLDRALDLQSTLRDAPARHRTLREAIDWSYGLLPNDQQAVFRRLAVFVGGCSLDAAQTVCGNVTSNAFESLTGLVERNLVSSVDSGAGDVRFQLLETVREFATERLEASAEADAVRAAHAAYVASLVTIAEPALSGPAQRTWLDALARDLDNVRAALRWLLQCGDAPALQQAAEVAWLLWPFWWARGYLAEARRWADAILAHGQASRLDRARAAWLASTAALDQGDHDAAPALIAQCTSLFRELGDRRGLARALLVEGWAAPIQMDLRRALEAHQESVEHSRAAGDQRGEIMAQAGLANTAMLMGRLDLAEHFNAEALTRARQLRDAHSQAQVLEAQGVVALQQGDPARASALFKDAVPLCLEVGSLELLCYCLVGLSGVAVAAESLERAAQLLGAAEGLRARTGLGVWPVRADLEQRQVATVRAGLAPWPGALEDAWAAGRSMTPEMATQLALSAPVSVPKPAPLLASPSPLTEREQEVAILIARGKTSKEIADALVITERTADTHAAHIRDKLGLRSRAEIAAWVVRGEVFSAGS